jgi:hydroxymethylpyrimidine pyrophosphatase-like HAD family hydrolase
VYIAGMIDNSNITVAFDVDGTLIYQTGDKGMPGSIEDTPRYDVIQLFHTFQKLGCQMFIWSGGGVPYATRWMEKLGLQATVVEKGSFKPDITFDDLDLDMRDRERSLGRVNVQV